MTQQKTAETDIGKVVVAWLESQHWECFQEVSAGYGCPVCDIIARQGKLLWVVELKKSLTFDVLAQAEWWRRSVHFASVAVPSTNTRSRGRSLAIKTAASLGVGIILLNRYGGLFEVFMEASSPKLNRKPVGADKISERLCDEHKTFAPAGSASGHHWTPYQQTVRSLESLVRDEPGVTLSAALKKMNHHYSSFQSARCSLAKWIHLGKVPSLRFEGHHLKLFLVAAAEARGKRGA